MNENLEFDYTVTKKVEGRYLLDRLLMIFGYIVFGMIFFFGLYLAHLYQFIAFIILVEWIVVFFTWRYVSIEYRYETLSGGIKFYTVYGGKKKNSAHAGLQAHFDIPLLFTVWGNVGVGTKSTAYEIGITKPLFNNIELNLSYYDGKYKDILDGDEEMNAKGVQMGVTVKF